MNTPQLDGNWNATEYFKTLTMSNRLAVDEHFDFCAVTGLQGFEDAVQSMQTSPAMVCVSDVADGFTSLHNTPRTRRVKTVFMFMRHRAEDMKARNECMEIMREIFRQFMSAFTLERTRLEQKNIYIDPRINFSEIDRYFFSGGACAYFQIAVDVFTDLRYRPQEWL